MLVYECLFSPLGIDLHPDCLAFTVAALEEGQAVPLDHYIDFDKLFARLARWNMKVRPLLGSILFMLLLIGTIRPGKLWTCFRLFLGFVTKRGKRSFVIITVEQFMNEVYQDVQRLQHCTTSFIQKDGRFVPGCVYNHPDKRRGTTRTGPAHM